MPRNDGTGPLGGGPRTGWGRGRCGRSADEAGAVEGFHRGGYSHINNIWGDFTVHLIEEFTHMVLQRPQ